MPPHSHFPHLSLLLLLLLLPTSLSHSWHHRHIGRVLYATPHPSTPHILVATSLHILASLHTHTGHLHWRYIPSPSFPSISPLLALGIKHHPPSNHVIYAQYGDMLLQLDAQNGSLIHTRPMCGKQMEITQAGLFLPYCQQGGLEIDGVVLPHATQPTMQWSIAGARLVSHHDARLELEGKWQRNDALAYATSVWVAQDAIVVATQLGSLYSVAPHLDGQVLWRRQLADAPCVVLGGRRGMVGVVCGGKLWTVNVLEGRVHGGVGEGIVRGGVDQFNAALCVWGVDAKGSQVDVGNTCRGGRNWVEWQVGGDSVIGMAGGTEVWRLAVPDGGRVMTVIMPSGKHDESAEIRPAAVRVTKDRKLLYRDVSGEYGLVFWRHGEGKDGFYEMLVDLASGSVIEIVKHEHGRGEVVGAGGEGWFVFGSWNKRIMAQEVHVLDLYERVGKVSRVQNAIYESLNRIIGERVVEMLDLPHTRVEGQCPVDPGKEDDVLTQCLVNNDGAEANPVRKTPIVKRSSLLANQRILGMDVTQTELGLTEPSLAMTLESGQITLVSKVFLDAWSPQRRDEMNVPENALIYRPLLNLLSSSKESKYMALGESLPGIRGIAFAPIRGKESASRAVVFGIDLLYEEVQPAGTYDSLPRDFSYAAVVGMVVALGASLVYTQHLRSRAKLMQSWE